ncbi:unnamed protein product [Darwinula stevensoni]|uniref:histone deacetylase n=1 Tax=Darwinula stevensoni TaxID=69355 RepID=A0A7R8X0Z5_9CRUS|nr:unnamed protein product [Darwinula stevensoni]CAG0882234.1 unnamed protein product [Darwinula stevensoni]
MLKSCDVSSLGRDMEINPSFAPLPKKGDVESNNRGCVTETPVYPSLNSIAISGVMLENLPHEIIQLKQQQQLEQQFLLQHFQAQRRQMYQEHEKQLQEQIKMYLEKQSAQMEEEARLAAEREKEKLEALKNKDERDQSAIASSEVKQRLQAEEVAALGLDHPHYEVSKDIRDGKGVHRKVAHLNWKVPLLSGTNLL